MQGSIVIEKLEQFENTIQLLASRISRYVLCISRIYQPWLIQCVHCFCVVLAVSHGRRMPNLLLFFYFCICYFFESFECLSLIDYLISFFGLTLKPAFLSN